MNRITITEMDQFRLNSLIKIKDKCLTTAPELELLEEEVERAVIVDFPEVPSDLVTMNSRFRYLNVTDNRVQEITIVYPQHADLEKNYISVLASLGTALLGLRENEEINWTLPNGFTKRLKILEILYQPEASGDLHL